MGIIHLKSVISARLALAIFVLLQPLCGLAQDQAEATSHAGWISIAPPVLAIGLALAFRQVIPALFASVWLGAWAVNGLDLAGLWKALLDTPEVYVLKALADEEHQSVILFSMMIGGMVGIIIRNGGMNGIVETLAIWANSAKRASVVTAGMGLAVFFDDYANTLVVGNTMRPVTDRVRISREKLAYIVDTTAAPVATVALITTWVGTQVGLIDNGLREVGAEVDAYAVFLQSIAYSFYPLLALFFVFAIAVTNRDFGSMLTAERRARETGLTETTAQDDNDGDDIMEAAEQPVKGKPHRAINAILPVVVLIVTMIAGMYVSGNEEGHNIREIIGNADSYKALIWASMLAVLVAGVLSLGQRILTLPQIISAWFRGCRSMLAAMIILVLAWSLAATTEQLGTAAFLVSILGDTLNPGLLPALIFLLAAATAFSTGTSWGTMGILMPLVVPLAWGVLGSNNVDALNSPVLYSSIAGVLAGSVWGDHCSPISDTTILSSMASGCDHIEHVRTQLPYALLVGSVAIVGSILPSGFGVPWWVCLVLCAGLLLLVLRVVGTKLDDA